MHLIQRVQADSDLLSNSIDPIFDAGGEYPGWLAGW
jgi:hypothetical protein